MFTIKIIIKFQMQMYINIFLIIFFLHYSQA